MSGRDSALIADQDGATLVTEHTYVFTATIDDAAGVPIVVCVVFLPHDDSPAPQVYGALSEHLDRQPSSQEVWFVTHRPYQEHLFRLVADSDLGSRVDRPRRGFLIEADGVWTLLQAGDVEDLEASALPHDDAFCRAVLESGLRQMFCESRGLLTAHGDFHFGKPGRKHSKYFLRAQPAVARNAHAHLLAAALLREIPVESVRRLWVDTAGIATVAGAFGAVRAAHIPSAPLLLVDSFGGYEGLAKCMDSMSQSDAVLISCSTSGTLALRVHSDSGLPLARIVTAFYLLSKTPTGDLGPEAPNPILCDLTAPAEKVRDPSFVEPFVSFEPTSCSLCVEREEVAVPIEGDGFTPVTGTVTARRILVSDRTSDLNALAKIATDAAAMRVRHRVRPDRVRTVATLLAPIIERDSDELASALVPIANGVRQSVGSPEAVDLMLYVDEVDSRPFANRVTSALGREIRVEGFADALQELSELHASGSTLPQHVAVVCGVASSGRTLLDASRALRFLPETTGITYVVGIAHPETAHDWQMVVSSLSKRSATKDNGFVVGWTIFRERTSVVSDPWSREASLWQTISGRDDGDIAGLGDSIGARLEILEALNDQSEPKQLFVPSHVGTAADHLPALNRGFVFWNFAYADEPTEEEIYWTITSVLQRNRWSAATAQSGGQYMHISSGGQHYVIEPAMFDRFNDPVIQACILRGAAVGELDYSMDESRSRYVRELVIDAARHASSQRGAAVTEFLISLALGTDPGNRRDLRLHLPDLQAIVSELDALGDLLSPLSRGLTLYLRQELGLAPIASESGWGDIRANAEEQTDAST